jgi:hypothetical protein
LELGVGSWELAVGSCRVEYGLVGWWIDCGVRAARKNRCKYVKASKVSQSNNAMSTARTERFQRKARNPNDKNDETPEEPEEILKLSPEEEAVRIQSPTLLATI